MRWLWGIICISIATVAVEAATLAINEEVRPKAEIHVGLTVPADFSDLTFRFDVHQHTLSVICFGKIEDQMVYPPRDWGVTIGFAPGLEKKRLVGSVVPPQAGPATFSVHWRGTITEQSFGAVAGGATPEQLWWQCTASSAGVEDGVLPAVCSVRRDLADVTRTGPTEAHFYVPTQKQTYVWTKSAGVVASSGASQSFYDVKADGEYASPLGQGVRSPGRPGRNLHRHCR